jgi:hypothetical protein
MHCFFGLVDCVHIGALFVRVTVMSSCVAAQRGICPEELVHPRLQSLLFDSVSELGIRRIRRRQRLLPVGGFSILRIRRYGDEGYSKRQDARDKQKGFIPQEERTESQLQLCGEVA